MLKKLLFIAAAFGLAAQATRSLAARGRFAQARRRREPEREALRTWEGEGGTLRPPTAPASRSAHPG